MISYRVRHATVSGGTAISGNIRLHAKTLGVTVILSLRRYLNDVCTGGGGGTEQEGNYLADLRLRLSFISTNSTIILPKCPSKILAVEVWTHIHLQRHNF